MRPLKVKKMSFWGSVFKLRGLGNGDILRYWDLIVGKHLAPLCTPVRLSPKGTLFISATAESKIELRYKTPLILERLGVYLGKNGVRSLEISADFSCFKQVRQPEQNAPSLTLEAQAALHHALSGIKSAHLREQLFRLGQNVWQN